MNLSFGKNEKLKSRKSIEALFVEGKSIKKHPIKLLYLPSETSKKTQVTFAVPKRSFKLAVSRNGIKRQMREAYRLHKHLLTKESGKTFEFIFLYIGKDKLEYAQIETSLVTLLKTLSEESI
ncbi:MAG: ribonuclease P protein component [Candidatus Latescibacterota bacterium]|jgi:ribonuclease P protein component